MAQTYKIKHEEGLDNEAIYFGSRMVGEYDPTTKTIFYDEGYDIDDMADVVRKKHNLTATEFIGTEVWEEEV